MSKLIDKIKGAFKTINIFDEGDDREIPDTDKGIAKELALETGMNVDDIEKMLNKGKEESREIWARTFAVTTKERNMGYTKKRSDEKQVQIENKENVNTVNKEELDREEL